MQAIDLLRQVDASIMLISFILSHCFGSFLVLLLNFIEYLLKFVEVLTFPSLQLGVVSVAELRWPPSWGRSLQCFFLFEDLLGYVASRVGVSTV